MFVNRAVFTLSSFIDRRWQGRLAEPSGAPGGRALPGIKNPPENYGKEDQTTVAAFLLWRGS